MSLKVESPHRAEHLYPLLEAPIGRHLVACDQQDWAADLSKQRVQVPDEYVACCACAVRACAPNDGLHYSLNRRRGPAARRWIVHDRVMCPHETCEHKAP